jgi:biofilm PGA synthesis N-glycosyltransferase PgaC
MARSLRSQRETRASAGLAARTGQPALNCTGHRNGYRAETLRDGFHGRRRPGAMMDIVSAALSALVSFDIRGLSGDILDFVFFYPLFMSYVWTAGGLYYYFYWERHTPGPDDPPVFDNPPLVSLLVPCFNEGDNVDETIAGLAAQRYPNIEIIAINDGSKDNTGAALEALLAKYPKLRVIHLAKNQGKAMALRMGALVARGEFLVCVDGDAILHPNGTAHLIKHFMTGARVGAVTGNPRIRTRSSMLGRIQVCEFSSIVGLIKRSQRIYGNVFTISGVIAAFRRAALQHCGYWSLDKITEDIAVSWSLELNHWQIRYEPSALCWILMPETFKGLWRQRLRWAQGGAEVFLENFRRVCRWRHRRMWLVVAEYISSILWAYALALSVALWGIGKFVAMPEGLNVPTLWPPAFWGLLLATSYLVQSIVALAIESRYETGLWRYYVWAIWYPLAFWFVSFATSLVGFPKALFKKRGTRGIWTSPDRGFRTFTPTAS